MTGRELIIYILSNNLEDEPVIDDNGRVLGFLTIDEYASKKDVGVGTVKAWIKLGYQEYVKIGDTIYIPDYTKRRKE